MRTDSLLITHYAQPVQGSTLEALDALLATLIEPAGEYCLSFDAPCLASLATLPDTRAFCLRWGRNQECFVVKEVPGGLAVTPAPKRWGMVEQWLFRALDPDAVATRERASVLAAEQVALSESTPVRQGSFWVQARATASVFENLGLQVQGGYRRWLSQYVLVSAGGGYERTVASLGPWPRDAMLLTARAELSSYDAEWQRAHLGLPVLSGYFGLTGVISLAAEPQWTTRAYVGFSCIVPLSFEFGVSVSARMSSEPHLYLAAGLGL